ncbi:MAG: transferrin-binding protein-like solute binding protein, partial [Alphaproteobacteria bacterium]|nr:transferrin-binding protein-like solute binding protein [Alphaproteobacteria bacterium]
MMKSQFSIITTLIFSIALTACGGGGSGGSTGDVNISRPDTTEDFNFTRELNTITVANQKATDDKGHTSLEAFADAATAENPIDITVQGLAVLFNDSTNYTRTEGVTWLVDDELNPKGLTVTRTATLSRTPILSDTAHLPTVKFISDGTAISAEIYADETYTNTTIDRSTIFGYDSDSNYMAYISWNKAQDADFSETNTSPIKYNKMGMMIAGIETDDDDIPLSGSATFNGKGKGIYDNDVNDNDAGYATIFDVTATVDFGANNVTIASENTKKADNTNVSDLLDFSTTALTYTANNISGTVTASGLSGTLDARFYGGRAWEFGGTFALTDATSYYYGAFGVERTEYFDTFALTSASKAAANPVTATSITAGTNDSLTLVAEAGDNTAFIMDGI